jgi:hypothetical protein
MYALAKDYQTPNRTGILFQGVLKRLDSPFTVEKIGCTTTENTTSNYIKILSRSTVPVRKFLARYRTMETSDADPDQGTGIWDSVLF